MCTNKIQIKPGNILLDRDLSAKVADVGLAQELDIPSRGNSFVSSVKGLQGGTEGYKDPALMQDEPRYGEKSK